VARRARRQRRRRRGAGHDHRDRSRDRSGTIALYLGGERITVGVNSGDAQNTIATAIGAAINAALDLPITAAVATNVVTWTFRHKGVAGQTYDVRTASATARRCPRA
jgi:phage tail sheath gpL-like